jgi:hypothetical protein
MAKEDDPKVRAVAKVGESGQNTARIYPVVPPPRPVFVDDTGRRGRWLAWLAVGLALVGLALVVALWWSQASATGG